MRKKRCLLSVLFLALLLLCGCSLQKAGTEKLRDLEYTVLAESEIPETLMEEIAEKKSDDLKLTWREGDDLYIVRGFGMQETGGYSIQMKEFYLADNAIYFKAELIGPENGEDVEKVVSYPYLVIKTERLEENVIFE